MESMHKIRTHHRHIEGRIFAWMALIMGFGLGMLLPIFPNFVKTIVKTDSAVSIFYSGMAFIMFLAAIASTVILRKILRSTIVKTAFLVMSITFFLLIFVTKLGELSALRALNTWFEMFLLITLALFVRDFAKSRNLGKDEGKYYRFQNIGFLAGPLIGGFLATKFDYELVFIIAAAVLLFGLAYFYHKHVIQKHPAIINAKKTSTVKLTHNVKEFFSNSSRAKAYLITLAFMSWISFKRLYIPLYVVLSGYLESMSGIILSLSLIPLILLEVKVGEYGDKHSVRKPISLGFLIIAMIMIFVFASPYPLINFLMLVLVNIGAAFIEPLQEDFVFSHLPEKKEDELYGVYMTADPIAFFLIPAIGAAVLFLLPFQYIFLIFGSLMALMSLFAWTKLKHL